MMKKRYTLTAIYVAICLLSFNGMNSLIYDNELRTYNNKTFDYYTDESFCVVKDSRDLGVKTSTEIPGRKEIGPLPDGKFICSYRSEGLDYIEIPYNKLVTPVHQVWERYFDSTDWVWRERMVEKKGRPYWTTFYKTTPFKTVMYFSIYDISEQIARLDNRDSAYQTLTDEFESKLSFYEHWKFDPCENKNNAIKKHYKEWYNDKYDAISYYTFSQDSVKTIRSIYYANKKVYVLEIQAKHNARALANLFLNRLTTLDLQKYNRQVTVKILAVFSLAILLSLVFVFLYIKEYRTKIVKNQTAHKLKNFALIMTTLNILFFTGISYKIYTDGIRDYFYYKGHYVDLYVFAYLTLTTLIVMNLLGVCELYICSKKEYRYDFMLNRTLNTFLGKRLRSERAKKLVVVFLYYPLIILGMIPLGVLCLLYVIPMALFSFIIIELIRLHHWINSNEEQPLKENTFRDYYVTLDLNRDATKDDVDRAFNSIIASLNSSSNNPLKSYRFINEIQEAYAVLGSINQLRPEYDIEYEAYNNGKSTVYSYSNKKLEKEILIIRNRLHRTSFERTKRFWQYVVFCIIGLIIISLFSYLTVDKLHPNKHRQQHNIYYPF